MEGEGSTTRECLKKDLGRRRAADTERERERQRALPAERKVKNAFLFADRFVLTSKSPTDCT